MKEQEVYNILENNLSLRDLDIIYKYIESLKQELSIITKDFEKIYCENQELKQELDKLKENKYEKVI